MYYGTTFATVPRRSCPTCKARRNSSIISFILQGNSEKCTGAFKLGCRVIFYVFKSCHKSGLISLQSSIEFIKKIIVGFNLTNINICKFIPKNIFDQVSFWMYIMTPVLKISRRLFLWNIVRSTFPNQAVLHLTSYHKSENKILILDFKVS